MFTKGPPEHLHSPKGQVWRRVFNQSQPCPWCSDGVGLGLVDGRVSRWGGVRFNSSALHVGDQLVGDLGQYIFRQPSHAQHVVASAVHVVSERDKLLWHGKEIYDWKERVMFRELSTGKVLLLGPLHLQIIMFTAFIIMAFNVTKVVQ